jgi:drug/metabolite transporter (DMT)-like permease
MQLSQHQKGATALAHVGLFYAAAIWGSTFYLVKQAIADVHPVTLIAYRFLIAGAILLGFLLATRRPLFRGFGRGLILGVIIWLLYVPQTIGLGMTTAANSGFITGLFVVFIPVFLATLFRSNPPRLEWLAAAVAIAGLWVLTGGLRQMNTGDALTLIATFTYALHVLLTDKYMKCGADPVTITCQQFLVVGVLSVLTIGILGLPLKIDSSRTTWIVLFLALFPTLSAYVIQVFAQRIISPVRVSLIFAFEPVFAGVFAWTLGGEAMRTSSALGGFLIFLALVISGVSGPPNKVPRRAPQES